MSRPDAPRSAVVITVITLSQFAGTSLWFAGNAVVADLQAFWPAGAGSLSTLTSAVQLGFITGTLLFAFFSVADRLPPRYVFFSCSLLSAACNLLLIWLKEEVILVLLIRFFTGFFLAGIYPVGMKIAAMWFRSGLGKAIGFLVGALVLGTAFPHLLRAMGATLPWEQVILVISGLAIVGGIAMLVLPDGPFGGKSAPFHPAALVEVFRVREFRGAAFGYFGHMWELYTFWAFVPVLLASYASFHQSEVPVFFWSFLIIGSGAIGCIGGGFLAEKVGSARVAAGQLAFSGSCCLLSPLLFFAPPALFLPFLLLWGITVVGDSPQFSAISARTAPPAFVGTALTLLTCIGFSITIVSLQVVGFLNSVVPENFLLMGLALGPMLGLRAMHSLLRLKKVAMRQG